MGTIRRILKHVEVEIARGTRRCRRHKDHRIDPGEACLSIREEGLPFSKSYCKACSLLILKQSAADLRAIRDVLFPELQPPIPTVSPSPDLGQTLVVANRKRSGIPPRPSMKIEVYEATPSISKGLSGVSRPQTPVRKTG